MRRAAGHPSALNPPPALSIHTSFTPSGASARRGSRLAAAIRSVHAGNAPVAPVNAVTPLSSRPIHTTASRSPA
ncbi:MAG: hypothetical protein CALGDGBN_03203 [Pseudomonadales bacterium]|nr:hypothetical protein [Pseudomonadales bacterium]